MSNWVVLVGCVSVPSPFSRSLLVVSACRMCLDQSKAPEQVPFTPSDASTSDDEYSSDDWGHCLTQTIPQRQSESWWTSHPLNKVPCLAVRLLWEIMGGAAWIVRAARLMAFAVALWPGWCRCIKIYLLSPNIIKNVKYGPNGRNYLDVYLPRDVEEGQKAPVVVLLTGGAWMIGYKAWCFQVGRALARFGYLVVTPDYRNYPQATVEGMVLDVHTAMNWVFNNIHKCAAVPCDVLVSGYQCCECQL